LNDSREKRIGLAVWALCTWLCVAAVLGTEPLLAWAEDQSTPASDQSHPRPVTPPHRSLEQGFRLAVVAGLNFLPLAGYSYDTRVVLPDGRQLNYAGTQNAPGGTLFLGVAITPRGPFRRLTLGANFNGGGLESWARPVIPNGVSAPFSQQSLGLAIQRKYGYHSAWHPLISPYIEHELRFLFGNRLRIGYQYWRQRGSYSGFFTVSEASQASAEYNVGLRYSSHLVRLSLDNYTWLDDADGDVTGSQRSKRKSGLVQQAGVLAGTHGTVIIFVDIGACWRF
jgi:hypothetical protein